MIKTEYSALLFNIRSHVEAAVSRPEAAAVHAFEAGCVIGSARRLMREAWLAKQDMDLNQKLENLLHLCKGALYYSLLPNNSEEGIALRLEEAADHINNAVDCLEEAK